jgi:hypothetical protein
MSTSSVADITLQINLSAGDLAYAEQTLPTLVTIHRPDVREVLVVADGCRPQSTPWVDAAAGFPSAEFKTRLARLRELCTALQARGVIDRIVWLEPDVAALRQLNARYVGMGTPLSHDHLGHAFSAYFLGWESARTRYVAHFDADIILWQQQGFSWLQAAVTNLDRDETLLAASPRIAPVPSGDHMVDVDAAGSGWLHTWPLDRTAHGWRSPWFSTRCHVMDRQRLERVLPLLTQHRRESQRRAARIERWLSRCHGHTFLAQGKSRLARSLRARVPAFPLPPEVLLHERAQSDGFACLYLDDPRAWFIHPDTKPDRFLKLLPRLLASVCERGECPPAQRGLSGVQFAAWEELPS